MDCGTVKALLCEYIDGELSEELNKEIYNHLCVCKSCRQEMDGLLFVKTVLRANNIKEDESLPRPEFKNKLCSMFENVEVTPQDKSKHNMKIVFCLVCIAICVMILISEQNSVEVSNPTPEFEQVQYVIISK